MAKDQAVYFLSEESLEALEASQGAIYLIRFPRMIEENNKKIQELEGHRLTWVKMIEEEQKGVDAYHALPWIKRMSKKHKLDKDAHVLNLGNFAQYVADLDSKIGELMMQNRDMAYGYNQFVAALLNVNISPEDVVAEYHRVKDMLEKKARGEWVEPVIETPAAREEANVEAETVVTVQQEPVTQNSKKIQRLTPREKFERRLALTAQKQANNAQKGKQPGDN